jgi:RNA recognition motif-containing protein
MNLYVGNLSQLTTEDELEQAFVPFGQVRSVTIVKDSFNGESRGFGFVEMPVQAEALAAISGLAGKEVGGRRVSVNEARPRNVDRRRGGRNGGGHRF